MNIITELEQTGRPEDGGLVEALEVWQTADVADITTQTLDNPDDGPSTFKITIPTDKGNVLLTVTGDEYESFVSTLS